ncbi:MAG: hypothetical protein R3D82_07465 [Xanthobacteraceae bacterium]
MSIAPSTNAVMAGLVPGIHVSPAATEVVDGRAKPGHDNAERTF